jgi:hypothetical protein
MRFSETKVARQAKNRGVPKLRKIWSGWRTDRSPIRSGSSRKSPFFISKALARPPSFFKVKFRASWVPNLARIWISLLSLPLLTSLLSSHRAIRSRIFLRTTVLPQSPLVSFLSFSVSLVAVFLLNLTCILFYSAGAIGAPQSRIRARAFAFLRYVNRGPE